MNFNTSYVSVQGENFLELATQDYYFNTSYVSVQADIISKMLYDMHKFQYIICFGSRNKTQEGFVEFL